MAKIYFLVAFLVVAVAAIMAMPVGEWKEIRLIKQFTLFQSLNYFII